MALKKAATSFDVARVAGVSRSAVSRAFTAGASVSTRTRERVMVAAAQLDYRPNAIARSLIMQRSSIVGLVVAEITNPFYSAALETISRELQKNGLHVLLFSVGQSHDIDQALPALLQYQVDGVIITSGVFSSEVARRCAEAGRP
ncbi:MAG: LacI family DNA-binding transcriptional regulator, partial [Alphaproteobacteria bacterium]